MKNSRLFFYLTLCFYSFVGAYANPVTNEYDINDDYSVDESLQESKKQVKGQILDVQGNPVIGAAVMEKGTSNGTITDFDGVFTFNVAENSVIEISYIGYQSQTVKPDFNRQMILTLKEDAELLEEVVVVGYGVQKKVNLTAAVQTVDTHDLENRPVKSLSEMLTASVPGLNVSNTSASPTAEPSLNIRGFTGMNASGAPLVLVDNVPMDIRFVNPNDVESISVLKDAAASAIYGSRAPNGVILITTKSGKEGKMSITYDGSVQIAQPIGLHESINGYEMALMKNNSRYNVFQSNLISPETLLKLQQYVNGEIDYVNEILPNGKYDSVNKSHANVDNFDLAFRDNVINTKHNIGISGGTEKLKYYGSVGFVHNDGLYQSDVDWMKRYTSIFKVDAKLTNWLNVGTRVNFSRQDSEKPRVQSSSEDNSEKSFYQMLGWPSYCPAYNDNGSPNEFSKC